MGPRELSTPPRERNETMPEPKSTNIARIVPHVARATREANLGQRGVTVWFTWR